jgi:hypothetical protein
MRLMPGMGVTPGEPGFPETPVTLSTPATWSTAAMPPAPGWWLGTENPPLPESPDVERLKS